VAARNLGQLADDLSGYTMTKGSLHFPVDRPLPKAVVTRLIAVRRREADQRSRRHSQNSRQLDDGSETRVSWALRSCSAGPTMPGRTARSIRFG
jgi:hypothetical protein